MARRSAIGYLESADPLLLQPHYPVFNEETKLGRDAEQCQIILSRDYVSRQHCALMPQQDGLLLVDLGTTNGTFINGSKIKRHLLQDGDRIGLGRAAPHHFVFTNTATPSKRKYMLPPQSLYRIGRASQTDLPLPQDPTVSGLHARLRVASGRLLLDDLGSANGTFVNGVPVSHAEIGPEDVVRIGSCELLFQYSSEGLRIVSHEKRNQVSLEAVNLMRSHKRKILLRDISLVVRPGEYVGVLGPSGAGKSTLLNALNGFQPANGGKVLLNGVSLYASYDMFRNAIGYVPQDDIIHRELTVERSLEYTAQLRLPRDTTSDQIAQQVTSVIETLGLSHVRRNPVANLSGGQRKRVSIGCELLTKPSLLFLDEPTSGLDPSTEEKLMRHFRQMSEQGQTVILTTHILYNLSLLDLVVFLARGRLVYFGPVTEVCSFFSTAEQTISRPIEIFDLLEPETPDSNVREQRAEFYEKRYRESALFKQYITDRNGTRASRDAAPELTSEPTPPSPAKEPRPGRTKTRRLRGFIKSLIDPAQWAILTRRVLDIKLSFPSRLAVPLLTPIILALLTATTEIGDQEKLNQDKAAFAGENGIFLATLDQSDAMSSEAFLEMKFEGFAGLAIPLSLPLTMIMTAVFLGTLSACLEISGERSIYLRERAVNLSIPTYVASKLPALFLLTAVQCFAYVLISMVVLRPAGVDILPLSLICVGVAWVSCMIGLFISSLDPTPGQNSVILAVIAVLPQMIFSGAMAPAFYGGMSTVIKAVAAVLPARWGFELMLSAVYRTPDWAEKLITGPADAGQMGFRFGWDVFTVNALALGALAVGYFFLTCVSLKRYDKL